MRIVGTAEFGHCFLSVGLLASHEGSLAEDIKVCGFWSAPSPSRTCPCRPQAHFDSIAWHLLQDAVPRTRRFSMRVYGIIPARLQSSRLPRKLLLAETGKPLLQYTWEQACRAKSLAEVIVATDSEEIARAVERFGGRVEMTGEHPSGTDRIAEVVRRSLPRRADRRQHSGGRAGDRSGAHRSVGQDAGRASGRRNVDAGDADHQPPRARRSFVQQGRLRGRRPGALFQPGDDSRSCATRSGTNCCRQIRPGSCTWACTRIGSSSC